MTLREAGGPEGRSGLCTAGGPEGRFGACAAGGLEGGSALAWRVVWRTVRRFVAGGLKGGSAFARRENRGRIALPREGGPRKGWVWVTRWA
ncbi:hypothetical protein GCM10010168_67880 [Actinoplanes ianthinogenes]|uniref:Uncharacterized protein n=1 Tax=Actinoplanes ianthinogenes TaxID=122358 RepID=A0ABM7LXP4_9ACTN|nr:hypothetical protein Aiant_46420 [Actinoplanes ianthinogenes]GGR39578.1 hypothetical protein GCM10010168_67880 [Actinoplanes ianthinogenes]